MWYDWVGADDTSDSINQQAPEITGCIHGPIKDTYNNFSMPCTPHQKKPKNTLTLSKNSHSSSHHTQ